MGLDLIAVNKDYGYKKIWYDSNDEIVSKPEDISNEDFEEQGYWQDVEDLETNKRYCDSSIGYIGFMRFRTELAKKYGLIDYYNWLTNFGTYYVESKDTQIVVTSIEQADKDDLKSDKFMECMRKLDSYKNKEWYDLLPILLHNDGEGFMSLEQVKRIYPKIKEFLQPYIENNQKSFGYIGRDWEWFEKDFLDVLEEVIKNKGKLLFS